MGFCGYNIVFVEGVRITECFADILCLIPSGVLLLAIAPNVLLKWFKLQSSCRVSSHLQWVRFPAHTARWIITILLIFFQILEIIEGIISDAHSMGTNFNFYIPQMLFLLGAIFTLIHYNFTETYNVPKFLLALLIYWGILCVTKLFKLLSLYEVSLAYYHARVNLVWLQLILGILLFAIDGYVLVTKVSHESCLFSISVFEMYL